MDSLADGRYTHTRNPGSAPPTVMGRLLMSRDWMMRVASLPAVMTPLPLSPLNAARQFREKIAVFCF